MEKGNQSSKKRKYSSIVPEIQISSRRKDGTSVFVIHLPVKKMHPSKPLRLQGQRRRKEIKTCKGRQLKFQIHFQKRRRHVTKKSKYPCRENPHIFQVPWSSSSLVFLTEKTTNQYDSYQLNHHPVTVAQIVPKHSALTHPSTRQKQHNSLSSSFYPLNVLHPRSSLFCFWGTHHLQLLA